MKKDPPLSPGSVIAGRYQIEARLGRGGMAAVYRAFDRVTNLAVAIKLLPANHEPKDRTRFEREAGVLAQLQHPNAMKFHDSGEDRGTLYIVQELLAGPTLRRVLDGDRGWLELPRAIELARQLADVLTAAHAISMVHRDLKPENIMLERAADGSERLVLIDFGLAFISDADTLGRITTIDKVSGTPRYYSPEQACGDPIGPASDIYSFGCVMFELVTGTPPFTNLGIKDLVHAHLFRPPPSARSHRPDLSVELDHLILSMLAKTPVLRPTAHDVVTVLASADGTGEPPPAKRRRANTHIGKGISRKPAVRCAVVGGVLEPAVALELAAAGIIVLSVDVDLADADCILMLNADPQKMRSLHAKHPRIIASATPHSAELVGELTRAGAAKIVFAPVSGLDLIETVSGLLVEDRE